MLTLPQVGPMTAPADKARPAPSRTFRMAFNPGAVLVLCRKGKAHLQAIQAFRVESLLIHNDRMRWTLVDGSGSIIEGGHGWETLHPLLNARPVSPPEFRLEDTGLRVVFELELPRDHEVRHLNYLQRTHPQALQSLRLTEG